MTSAGVETAILHLDLAGTIYPFRVGEYSSNKWASWRCNTVNHIPTLNQLACRRIVQDRHLTKLALECIPKTLSHPLLEAAFLGKHDIAADLIIAHWPYATLRLADVLPGGIFPDLSYASYRCLQLERLCESLSYTTGFVSGFVHYLKKSDEPPGSLKCLDITGFPTAEVVAVYLLSHCVIAINEHRQGMLWKRMLELKAERARLYPDNPNVTKDDCKTQPGSFREGQGYVARIDLRIDSESLLDQLLPCFTEGSGADGAKLRISIGNLYITGLRESAVMRILQSVQLNELSGLCLSFSRLGNWPVCQLVDFLRYLGLCNNLSSLDLSNCGFDLASRWSGAVSASLLSSHIRAALSELTSLRRLNLSANKLSGKVSVLLPSTLRLTHLSLNGCRLTPGDISFLASSEFDRRGILQLDLGHLRVNTDPEILNSLKDIFTNNVWHRLSLLILSSSRFEPASLLSFSQTILAHEEKRLCDSATFDCCCRQKDFGMCDMDADEECDSYLTSEFERGLAFLDLCEESSKVDSNALLKAFNHLFQMKHLRYLKLEYPRDCLSLDNLDGFLDLAKKEFFDNHTQHIREQFNSNVELIFNQNLMDFQ